jgi:hypothetical protein
MRIDIHVICRHADTVGLVLIAANYSPALKMGKTSQKKNKQKINKKKKKNSFIVLLVFFLFFVFFVLFLFYLFLFVFIFVLQPYVSFSVEYFILRLYLLPPSLCLILSDYLFPTDVRRLILIIVTGHCYIQRYNIVSVVYTLQCDSKLFNNRQYLAELFIETIYLTCRVIAYLLVFIST